MRRVGDGDEIDLRNSGTLWELKQWNKTCDRILSMASRFMPIDPSLALRPEHKREFLERVFASLLHRDAELQQLTKRHGELVSKYRLARAERVSAGRQSTRDSRVVTDMRRGELRHTERPQTSARAGPIPPDQKPGRDRPAPRRKFIVNNGQGMPPKPPIRDHFGDDAIARYRQRKRRRQRNNAEEKQYQNK
jgi:hypothetical protein